MDTLIQTEFPARGRPGAPDTLNINPASNTDYNRYLFAKSRAALNKSILDFPEHASFGANSSCFLAAHPELPSPPGAVKRPAH